MIIQRADYQQQYHFYFDQECITPIEGLTLIELAKRTLGDGGCLAIAEALSKENQMLLDIADFRASGSESLREGIRWYNLPRMRGARRRLRRRI